MSPHDPFKSLVALSNLTTLSLEDALLPSGLHAVQQLSSCTALRNLVLRQHALQLLQHEPVLQQVTGLVVLSATKGWQQALLHRPGATADLSSPFACMTGLRNLRLSKIQVANSAADDAALGAAVACLTALTSLSLDSWHFGNPGVHRVWPGYDVLLPQPPVSDAASAAALTAVLTRVTTLEQLAHLHLSNLPLHTEAATAALATCLAACKGLKQLDFTACELSPDSITCLAFTVNISAWHSDTCGTKGACLQRLHVVHFTACEMQPDGAKALCPLLACFQALQHLTLRVRTMPRIHKAHVAVEECFVPCTHAGCSKPRIGMFDHQHVLCHA